MTFSPARSPIANITQANPAIVTTTVNHNLTTGQIVRVHVPPNFGMFQLNNLLLSVTVLSPTTFSLQYVQTPQYVDVDSTNFQAFTTPAKPGFTAEIIAAGSGPTPQLEPPVYIQNGVAISRYEDATYNNSTVEIPF